MLNKIESLLLNISTSSVMISMEINPPDISIKLFTKVKKQISYSSILLDMSSKQMSMVKRKISKEINTITFAINMLDTSINYISSSTNSISISGTLITLYSKKST